MPPSPPTVSPATRLTTTTQKMKIIATALVTNTTIATLDITHNKIGDNVVLALADTPMTNETLVNIKLRRKKISLTLADMLMTNDRLLKIELSSNVSMLTKNEKWNEHQFQQD